MRVRLTAVALLLTLVTTVWAADQFIVEDWSKHAVGASGIPDGWKGQNWGSPKYDFMIEDDGGRKVLHMKSANEGSTIAAARPPSPAPSTRT